MTIEIWSPIVCANPSCSITIDASGNGNVLYVSTITRCSFHNLFDGQPLVNMLLREDARYQSGMNWVASSFPTSFSGGNWWTPVSGISLRWLISGVPPSALSTRSVHLSGTGFGSPDTSVLQTAMNTDLGSGAVLVSGSLV